MWEDEDTESTDELLDSVDSLAKDTKSNHARADYNKEEDPSHTPTENDLSPNKQYDSMLNKLSKYIDTNKALLPPNLNQLGFLPAPDKMKTINTIYDLNSVMDSLGKLKKDLHETTPGVLDKIEKELHELSFNCGSAANKIIIDEMDKYLRQVSLQVEKDIHIKQELYNNLKKLSSHNYWDLALSNLIQTNPEFCFYMSNLIKKHPDIMKITRLMGNLKVITTGGMSVDPDDVTPSGVKSTGAELVTYGSPVLPGAMFLLAYYGEVPIMGLPACVMYFKATVFDLVLPRVLAGEKLTRKDIAMLGHGGLCKSCKECRYPECPFGK